MVSFLRREIVWMLLSLALATALWAIVTNQQNPPYSDYFQSIPVRVKGAPSGLIVRDEIKPIRLKVTAPKDVWDHLTSASFEAFVDASKAGQGVQDVPVRVEALDSRVRIDEIQPSKVTLRLENLASKDVPVNINVIGSVPFGYTSKPPKVSPEQVTVSGPESQVATVSSARVEVHAEGATSTISQPFKPEALTSEKEAVKSVTIRPESVFVELPIEREITYKTVPVAPRITGMVAMGYQIVGVVVDPTTVTVVGDPKVLADQSYLPTKAVDTAGAKGDLTIVVEPDLPDGVTLVRKQNLVVRVFVSPLESSEVVTAAPTVKGLNGDLQAAVAPSAVKLTLYGPMPILSTIKPQDIKVEVDATGLGIGIHDVKPTISLPASLRLDATSPETITLTIRRQ